MPKRAKIPVQFLSFFPFFSVLFLTSHDLLSETGDTILSQRNPTALSTISLLQNLDSALEHQDLPQAEFFFNQLNQQSVNLPSKALAEARLHLAKLQLDLSQIQKAQKTLEPFSLEKTDPLWTYFYILQAKIHYQQASLGQTLKNYRLALQRKSLYEWPPNDKLEYISFIEEVKLNWTKQEEATKRLIAAKLYTEALNSVNQLLEALYQGKHPEFDPRVEKSHEIVWKWKLQKARLELQIEEVTSALSTLEIHNEDYLSREQLDHRNLILAVCYAKLHDLQAASHALEQLSQASLKDPEFIILKAEVYAHLANYPKALSTLKPLLLSKEYGTSARLLYAFVLSHMQRQNEAIDMLTAIEDTKSSPGDRLCKYTQLANLYRDKSQAEYFRALQKAVETDLIYQNTFISCFNQLLDILLDPKRSSESQDSYAILSLLIEHAHPHLPPPTLLQLCALIMEINPEQQDLVKELLGSWKSWSHLEEQNQAQLLIALSCPSYPNCSKQIHTLLKSQSLSAEQELFAHLIALDSLERYAQSISQQELHEAKQLHLKQALKVIQQHPQEIPHELIYKTKLKDLHSYLQHNTPSSLAKAKAYIEELLKDKTFTSQEKNTLLFAKARLLWQRAQFEPAQSVPLYKAAYAQWHELFKTPKLQDLPQLLQAISLAAQKPNDQLANLCEAYLQYFPNSPQSDRIKLSLAICLQHQGQSIRARQIIDELLAREDACFDRAMAMLWRYSLNEYLNGIEGSYENLQKIILKQKNNEISLRAYFLIAQSSQFQAVGSSRLLANYENVERKFDLLFHESSTPSAESWWILYTSQLQKAQLLSTLERTEEALSQLEITQQSMIAHKQFQDERYRELFSEALYLQATLLLEKQNYSEAKTLLENLAWQNKAHDFWSQKSTILLAKMEYENRAYQKSLQHAQLIEIEETGLDENMCHALLWSIRSLRQLGEYNRAIKLISKLAYHAPCEQWYHEALWQYARVLARLGDEFQAKALLKELAQMNDTDSPRVLDARRTVGLNQKGSHGSL